MILPAKDVLTLLGPVFTLLVLSFGFLQVYPKLFESVAENRSYGAELELRTLRRALRVLKWEITFVAASAVFILLYPIAGILQRSWKFLRCSDEILLTLALLSLLLAVSFVVWGTWKIGIERLIKPEQRR